jgi:hypothetical protein
VTTYRWGYDGKRLTLAEMETRWSWNNVHPELRRRAVALMDAAQAAGHDLGIGEGARNAKAQLAEFLRRHNEVATGGCCKWDDKRYALKPGMAPMAPPGSSNHEDGVYEGDAIAIDFVGWEDHWFDAHCEEFGIKNFGGAIGPDVNGEEWHGQFSEFPNSRSAVNAAIAAGKTVTVWPIPGTPPPPQELPMKYYALPPTSDGNRAHIVVIDGACRYRTNGDTDPLPEIKLPEEQYVQLRKSAGLGPG